MFLELQQSLQAPPGPSHITRLPNELLLEISQYLNVHSTSSLSQANQHFSLLLAPRLQALSQTEKYCVTALYLAAAHGHSRTMHHLLSQGAPVAIEYGGNTLIVSSMSRLTDADLDILLLFLMEQGPASIVLSEPRRESALHRAAGDGNERLVRGLLAKGVSMLRRDVLGWTPLHWALNGGNAALLRVFMAHAGVLMGADRWP